MHNDETEFGFLPGQAEALGVATPSVRRVSLTLDDGRTLSALLYGKEPATTVLLHGAGLNAHTWDITCLHLGQSVLAVDLPGHGESSWRSDAGYSPRTLAPDITAAIHRWASSTPLVVGHSLGGLTAAAVLAASPGIASDLIVVDITPGIDMSGAAKALRQFYEGPTDFASRDEMTERAIEFGFGGSAEATARGVFFNTRQRPDGRFEWKHHFAHLAAQVLTNSDQTKPATQRMRMDEAAWADFQAVTAPLTLIHASNGFLTEANLTEFRANFPTAPIITLAATHNVQESAPAELAQIIQERSPSSTTNSR